ncbi:hypothetical protein [Novosphingobium panipatense]|uniref:hypothetical protein n=1 Tax=Novosphingobium panipatense TaxID=428991 RepID=UPI00361140BE
MIEIGTSCSRSSTRRAVTTISSVADCANAGVQVTNDVDAARTILKRETPIVFDPSLIFAAGFQCCGNTVLTV